MILPADSEYVQHEIQEMADQLDHERRLTGDATFKTLLREMWTIPGNRNRAVISILLMIFQQMTGVNAIVSLSPPFAFGIFTRQKHHCDLSPPMLRCRGKKPLADP
ncbi:hypothetical protein ACHAPE_001817 [Trichoderma viride]